MKNRRHFTLVAVALALLLLVACGSGPGEDSALQSTRWVLASLSGEPPLAGRAPSAEFAADQISGSAGCNTYFGTYEVSDGEITIGDLAVTEMWCMEPEGLMDQEAAFLQALNTAASYRLDAGQLELYDNAGSLILVFGSEAAERPDPAHTSPDTAGATLGQ
ncbi:MAG: META domain-containing protein, partial [Anaerolineae bacterium]